MANEDKATRYHRLQRRASVAAVFSVALVLSALLLSGGAVTLRDRLEPMAGPHFLSLVAGYAVALALLIEGVQLPFAFYQGVVLEERYGLSTSSARRWWTDRVKSLGLGLAFGLAAAVAVWTALRLSPGYWWLMSGMLFASVGVALAHIAPVLLLPLFYDFRPLQRPALVERLLALSQRANAHVGGVFEWRVSDRTRKANAALAGLGRTRRILLSDTLLAEHSDAEIEVILAHELAHHVHHDIWTAIALDAGLTLCGFYAADRALEASWQWLGLAGKDDVAGMGIVLLAGGAMSALLIPVAHALSRYHERRADRDALRMTGGVDAFVSAMKRLAAQNLAEEQPSRLTELLFHSHPPTSARIAAARAWAARQRAPAAR